MDQQFASASDFKQQYTAQPDDCIVIDVRTPKEYASERLTHCQHIPLNALDPKEFLIQLDQLGANDHQPIYILCQSGIRAQKACEQLQGHCPNPLRVIAGGLNALKDHEIDTIKGAEQGVSIERQVRIAAGLLILSGALLGFVAHPGFYIICAGVGLGLFYSGVSNTCAMALVLAKMPWNN